MEIVNFWQKKSKLSYLLAIFVFMRHISSFDNYMIGEDVWSYIVMFIDRFFAAFTPIAVPMFFIISGALFFKKYNNTLFVEKLKRRVRSLIVPYFVWNIIYMLFSIVATLFLSKYFIGRQLFDFSWSNVLSAIILYGENGHFWFIFDLIVFVLFSPVIYYLVKDWRVGGGILLLIVVLIQFGIGLPGIFHHKDSIFFFMLGAILGVHRFDMLTKTSKSLRLGGLLISLACATVLYFFPYDNMEANSAFRTLIVAIFCVGFYFAFDYTDRIKVHEWMEQSFLVFAMHGIIGAIIAKLLYMGLPKDTFFAIPNYFLTIFLTLYVIYLFAIVTKRYAPVIYRILSGGR